MWTIAIGVSLLGIPMGRFIPVSLHSPVQRSVQVLENGSAQNGSAQNSVTQNSEQNLLELRQLGIQQFQQGAFTQAIATFRLAITLASKAPTVDLTVEASLYSQLGRSHANLGEYETALTYLSEAQSRYEQIGSLTGLAEVDIYRGIVRLRQNNYDGALRLLDAAQVRLGAASNGQSTDAGTGVEEDTELAIGLDIGLDIEEWQQTLTGEALHSLAVAKAALGEYERAIALNQQALNIWESLPVAPALTQQFYRGRSLNNLGGIYYTLGDIERAQTYYQQALTISQTIGNQASEGRILTNLGLLERRAGRPEEAARQYQAALDILSELGDRASVSSTLNSLGIVYEILGDYDHALSSYERGLAIAEDIGNRSQQGNIWDGLGGLHYRQARYSKALTAYEKALAIHQAIDNQRGQAATLTNIGGTYADLGRHETALDYFSQALALSDGAPSIQAGILAAQGGVHRQLANLPEALRVSQQGLELAIVADDIPQQSQLLEQLGGLYGQQGDVAGAIAAYQQAIEVAQGRGHGTTRNNAAVARSLNSWGTLLVNYAAEGDIAQAQPLFQSALTIFQQLGDRTGESIVLSNLGNLYDTEGQSVLAIVFYKQAVSAHESIRGDFTALSSELQRSYLDSITPTYRRLADLLLQDDRVLEAQQVIDLLKVQEIDDYLRGIRGDVPTAGVAMLPSERQLWDEYAVLSDGAIAITQGLQALRQLQRPLTPAETEQKQQLDEQQRQLVRQFRDFSNRDDIIRYTDALTRTAREQSLSLPRLQDLSQNLRELEDPAVLLYPLILEDRIELVLVAPGVPPIHTPVQVDRITLNRTIQAYRSALTSPAKNPLPAAQQLYEWLIEPVELQLSQAQAQTILYAPDGPLRYVPLAALHNGDTWLVEQYRINNITAASIDDLTSRASPDRRILAGAFSDPETHYEVSGGEETFRFNGLPYAGAEVEALRSLQPDSTAYFNPDFSKARILPNMDDYPIVHLATHAAFLPGSPLDSFVLFGTGETVTLQEVQDEWFFGNLDLIVLSACQTGLSSLGEGGEEILGFGYLMQNAGVNAAMASLWTVDDGGTQTLMDGFYRGLLENDLTKAEALRQAQLALIGSSAGGLTASRGGLARVVQGGETEAQHWDRLSHPYYWSPFILIGNGL